MIQPTVFLILLLIVLAAYGWSVRARAAAARRSAAAIAAFDARITRLAQGCGDRLLVAIENRMERSRQMHELLLGSEVERMKSDLTERMIALGRQISRAESAQEDVAAAVVGRASETMFTIRQWELATRRTRS